MSESPTAATSLARRAAAVAVGLFAAWQLVYLPAANLIDFVPRRPCGPDLEPVYDQYQAKGSFTSLGPLQRAGEYAGDALDLWSELTGQEQGWALFAPGPPPYCAIPAVEFRFADGTADTALSPYEPADKRQPRLRLPLVDNRPFNFEAQFTYAVWYAPPEDIAQQYVPAGEIEKLVATYGYLPSAARVWRGPIRAWLAWRLKEYRAAHPERGEPVEVILKHRFISSPRPGERPEWTQPPAERPFARWRPADDSFEAYDAIHKRFVPVGTKP